MNPARLLPLLLALCFSLVTSSFADTQITSITAEPAAINPYMQESTTITVSGSPGVTGLVLRVLAGDGTVLHQGLPLSETGEGIYATSWDGKDSSGKIITAGTYQLRVYNLATTTYIGSSQPITVGGFTIAVDPGVINPYEREKTAVTVFGTPGMTVLTVRVLAANGTIVHQGLPLTETSAGVYTTSWDGKNSGGSYIAPGVHTLRVYNLATTTYLGTSQSVTVEGINTDAPTAAFTPTGTNTITFTINAAPAQTGMRLRFYNASYGTWVGPDGSQYLPLTETSTPGVYTANWTAVTHTTQGVPTMVLRNGTYIIYVHDGAGNQSPVTGSVAISGVNSLGASPTQFNPSSNQVVTLTASGAAGLGLKARILQGSETVNELSMVEQQSGVYTAQWDGRKTNGEVATVGTYSVQTLHVGSPVRYYPTASFQISVGTSAVTSLLNPFTPTGANSTLITVNAEPGQEGLKVRFYQSSSNYWVGPDGSQYLPLIETGTPGVYAAEWNAVRYSQQTVDGQTRYLPASILGDTTYTMYVLDGANIHSTTTGTVTIKGVSLVSAAPSSFNPFNGELTTLTARGAPGLDLRVKIWQGSTVISELALSEQQAGIYTTQWDGRKTNGELAALGSFSLQVVHAESGLRYAPTASGQIVWSSSAITSSENPFTPTGSNSTLITVNAAPGQVGLKVRFYKDQYTYWVGPDGSQYLSLVETATPGIYTAEWNGIQHDKTTRAPTYIMSNGAWPIQVYNSAGNQSTTSGSVTINGVGSISASPNQFNPLSNQSTALTVNGAPGLDLTVRIRKGSETINELALSEQQSGVYTAQWDGKKTNGEVAAVGSYSLQVIHAGSPVPYSVGTSVSIVWSTSAISSSQNPFTPTGSNSTLITVNAAPGQTGLWVRFYQSSSNQWYGPNGSYALPLTETATPGVYTAEWNGIQHDKSTRLPLHLMPDGTYTIWVYDSANNQSTTSGSVTVTGVKSLSVAPSPFTPGGGNFATITALAASGLNLETKVWNNATNTLVDTLPMVETSGTYVAEWYGKDRYGNFAGANTYRFEVYHVGSSIRYFAASSLVVNVAVFSISAAPNPFVPTGSNSVAITVRADAAQSGLTYALTLPDGSATDRFPLVETGSEGTYVGQWNGLVNGGIAKDGVCTIRVFGQSGTQFPATGTLTLSSAKSLTLTPNPFEATGSNSMTISAQIASGLDLEARINNVVTLPLQENDGLYTADWDGKNTAGNLVPSGSYLVTVWNRDTGIRYNLQTSLTFKIIDTVPPETTLTDGPTDGAHINATSVTFGWKGSDNIPNELTYAYKLDDGAWSGFAAATSFTTGALADGPHTFSVKAKDTAGNEELTPVVRNFVVDTAAPLPPADFPATTTSTGVELTWTGSPSTDVYAYRIYWNGGSGAVNYSTPFAVVLAPATRYLAAIVREGDFQFALRAVDQAGNEDQNSSVTVAVTIPGFSLTVSPENLRYDRGQSIPLAGVALRPNGEPIADLPVLVDIESRGFHRQLTGRTNASGAYQCTFTPRSDEAGSYTVTASAMHQGVEKSVTAGFEILGLVLQPTNVTLEMSMNSARTVAFPLKNIGTSQLTGLAFELVDQNPDDGVTGSIDIASLSTTLASGASLDIPVQVTAAEGAVPQAAPVFTLKATAAEGSTESAILTVKAYEATGRPVLTPNPFRMSVGRETPAVRLITLKNDGFATMTATTLRLRDPEAFPWVVIANADLGDLEPGAVREIQVNFAPNADLAYGNYLIPIDLAYSGTVHSGELAVELTAATTGKAAFTVYDDTGSALSGADVSLISKEMYVNTTSQGTEEYPNVIKGKTDSNGELLLEDVNPGAYRYVVSAERHELAEGELTIEPGDVPVEQEVVLVTNLVDVRFAVTPTTITDQYTVTLDITYVTDLTKPTLLAKPSSVHLSFFPEEERQGTITITNTSNNAPVRNLTLNAAALDLEDNEVRLAFDNGSQVITLEEELGPKQSRTFAFKATIADAANAKLATRNLGNIQVTGEYTYSINGEARESTTTTPIPVLFSKPQELALPSITFVNDETDGDLDHLEYQETSERLAIRNNRTVACTFIDPVNEDPIRAISHHSGSQDPASIIEMNGPASFWSTVFNDGTQLEEKGDRTTFDITGLKEALESKLQRDRTGFLGEPRSLGFYGKWADRPEPDAYLIPVSIVTIKPPATGSPGGTGGTRVVYPNPFSLFSFGPYDARQLRLPAPQFNGHGGVKLQIIQKVSLEREAFNAALEVTPSVETLENVEIKLNVQDQNGEDASGLFYVLVTQQAGLSSLTQGQLSGPARISWQLIPSSSAGGNDAEGRQYKISADLSYAYAGKQYSFATEAETVTVKPMPKLTLDYYVPYVVMAGKPVKVRVDVTNSGAGAANNLAIASGQPKIVENTNNVPVAFAINGSSASSDPAGYVAGKLAIAFGEVAPGSSKSGYWHLTSTRNGYFVEFTADLKHENYLGVQLDPLVQEVNTHFVPAVGGKVTQGGCMMTGSVTVELRQNDTLIASDLADAASGNYFISDLAPGSYQLVARNSDGQELTSQPVTVLDGQPTAVVNITVGAEDVDTDQDGLSDCWEYQLWQNLGQGPNDDPDSDGLSNHEEYGIGSDPRMRDTDGDGLSDGDEVGRGSNPNKIDTDGDGINDGDEVNRRGSSSFGVDLILYQPHRHH